MTLVIDWERAADGAGRVAVAEPWARIRLADPAAAVAALTIPGPLRGRVLVDGRRLDRMPIAERTRNGLLVAPGRIGDVPALAVLDVMLMARRLPGRLTAWQAAFGSQRARALLADDEAAVRALAGRLGLSGWTDHEAVGLPAGVAALVDLARAVAARPRALVWRRPEWLSPDEQATVAGVLQSEGARLKCTVLEVTGPTGTLIAS